MLLSLAFSQHELGLTATAEQTLTDAERLAGYVGEPSLPVLINGQRGAMFLREGRLTEALQQLDRAVAALADAPEIDQCKIMLNRGEVNGLIGERRGGQGRTRPGRSSWPRRTACPRWRSTAPTTSACSSSCRATCRGPWS